jgi:hypothetical protein
LLAISQGPEPAPGSLPHGPLAVPRKALCLLPGQQEHIPDSCLSRLPWGVLCYIISAASSQVLPTLHRRVLDRSTPWSCLRVLPITDGRDFGAKGDFKSDELDFELWLCP